MEFLKELATKSVVYVPVADDDVVAFKLFQENSIICLDRPANIPPKTVIFPQYETLLTFTFSKKRNNLIRLM